METIITLAILFILGIGALFGFTVEEVTNNEMEKIKNGDYFK